MSSYAKHLKAALPEGLKQALLRLRSRHVDFGPGARIDSFVRFEGHASLGAGASVYGCDVGRWSYFGEASLAIFSEIGAFCSIAPHVIIGGGKHPVDYVTTSPLFYSRIQNPWGAFPGSIRRDTELPRTYVGNDVWMGYGAVVMPGVRVGDGAVIGAGAVVTRDVEPYGIAAGVPARLLRHRFDPGDVAWLLRLKWWDWPDAHLKRLRPQFTSVEALRGAVEASRELVAAGGRP